MAVSDLAGVRNLSGASCREHLISILDRCDDSAALADKLLAEFLSLSSVLGATESRLWRTTQDPAAVGAVMRFQATMKRALFSSIADRPLVDDWPALSTYLLAGLAHRTAEQLNVLYLTVTNQLISDEVSSLGTLDQSGFHPREIIHRALDLGAASLILAHNHPSGDPSPSGADTRTTRQLISVATPLNICVIDHVIVGHGRCVSLRASGLL